MTGPLVRLLLVAALVAMSGCPGSTPAGSAATPFVPDDPALVEANNRGVGLMGKFDYEAARGVFQGLADAHPGWLDVRANLAIATLNRQKDGDEAAARAILRDVLRADPRHLRATYCLAMLLGRESEPESLELFRRVAESDPLDAYAQYYYANALETLADRPEEALPRYRRAIELDPYLRSSYYRAAQILLRMGRRDDGLALLDEFTRLDGNPRGKTTDAVYAKMGPKAETLAVDLPEIVPTPRPPGPVFLNPRPLVSAARDVTWNAAPRRDVSSITVCDIDHDGDLDIFISDALREGAASNAVLVNDGDGAFHVDPGHALARVDLLNAVLWGDFDNDGLTDAYLCRSGPNQLWRQVAPGEWADVTDSTGTANGEMDTVDGAFVDADHDGDLDLFCVNADGPNELLNNNLDGTFRPIAQVQGVAGDGRGSRQVVFADFDHDRDLDVLVINEAPPHEAYVNDRLWSYRPADGMRVLLESDVAAAAAADLDADGQVELLLAGSDGEVGRWFPSGRGDWMREASFGARRDPSGAGVGLIVADVTGDGSPGRLLLFGGAWDGNDRLQYVTGGLTLESPWGADVIGFALVALDPAQGPSVVGWSSGGPPLLWPPGPGRHAFTSIALTGREDAGQSMRSNASGIGAHVAVRVDSSWTVLSTLRAGSGPGQSLQPLAVGLGGQRKIDFIAIDWSDGLFQSEIDLAAGRLHEIAETQRQVSSCPVLFAWNGERFEFVSDLLGVGGIGYMVAPGEYAEPRPWEHFLLPEGALRPREGQYLLRLGEPMEEACYLDAAALVAYDLPQGWRMTVDERMQIGGPAPTGQPVFYRQEMLPRRAIDGREVDVTDQVTRADLDAPPVGDLDHRFIGRLQRDQVLTLEFPMPLDDGPGEPILVADGWIEYPYSQTMFAAWQAGAAYRAPTIEARAADGRWIVQLEEFGYPAGMPRQMSVPLTGLPTGCTALRISTNQEIYWDRLAIAWAESCLDVRRQEMPLVRADLQRSGFARRSTGPQRQPAYDYDNRSPLWDTRHQRGFYTAFGPATDLVRSRDDGLAIFGPGEEVGLAFESPSRALPTGWARRFMLEAAGWCKDMDLYTRDGETLGPLPCSEDPAGPGRALHDVYNTRYQSGR